MNPDDLGPRDTYPPTSGPPGSCRDLFTYEVLTVDVDTHFEERGEGKSRILVGPLRLK